MSTSALPIPSVAPAAAGPSTSHPQPNWLAELLGLRLETGFDAWGAGFDGLAGLALRRNPRRAHLLVSRVLGKHLPVAPATALAAADQLAARLPADVRDAGPLVFGFAETATGLGHAVAAALPGAAYVSSTRRSGTSVLDFEEEHSHATAHRVLAPRSWFAGDTTDGASGDTTDGLPPVVLVDDELSTGRTAVNTIRAVHAVAPRPSWTVAAFLDLRPAAARQAFADLSREIGAPVRAVSLFEGELHVPADAAVRAADVLATADPFLPVRRVHPVRRLDAVWPAGLPLGGRAGWLPGDTAALAAALPALAAEVAGALDDLPGASRPGAGRRRVLVLGTEELMYVPMRLAAALAEQMGDRAEVLSQSTTRSPVAPLDRDGYAVRAALSFPAPDEPERAGFVYNLAPHGSTGLAGYDAVVVVCDPDACRADAGLLDALASCAPVLQVRLPEESACRP